MIELKAGLVGSVIDTLDPCQALQHFLRLRQRVRIGYVHMRDLMIRDGEGF